MSIDDLYIVFRDNSGKVVAINDLETGKSLSLPLEEAHPWTIELRERESQYGKLDLSDRVPEPETLEEAKAQKQHEIIEAAKEAQNALVEAYAPPEQTSWQIKLPEAKTYLEFQDLAQAPVLKEEALAIAGQVLPDQYLAPIVLSLAQKIVDKSLDLPKASAAIAGKRTRSWNAIANASSIEEVQRIVW